MPMISRRRLGVLAGALAAAAGTAARADEMTAPDVAVYCDPALARPLANVGADFRARTGVPVRVLAAPGTLLLELLQRGTRSDVLVTVSGLLDTAAQRSLVKPGTQAGPWRDSVVLAARDSLPGDRPIEAATLRPLLGDGRIAVIDPVAADRMDGPAALGRLGWSEVAAGRIDGMASGQEVAFAVASGSDRLGLLHRSDLAGHRNLEVVGTVDEAAAPPASYGAAIGHNVLSANAAAFLAYLNGPEATDRLRADGLEKIG